MGNQRGGLFSLFSSQDSVITSVPLLFYYLKVIATKLQGFFLLSHEVNHRIILVRKDL